MHDIVIRPQAKQEILAAYYWYEEKRVGLGDEFLLCLDATIERIRRTPEIYSIVHRNVRRALTKRFPYGVFFVIQESQITILAVMIPDVLPQKSARGPRCRALLRPVVS